MNFHFEIEDKQINIRIEDTEHYKIIEMEVRKNIVIYPIWFNVIGISNNKKFGVSIGVSESIFDEGNDFLNRYINDSINSKVKDLN